MCIDVLINIMYYICIKIKGINEKNMEKIRLSKYFSQNSVCSRRNADELIKQGRVKINGKIAVLGDTVDPEKDKILLDGKAVRMKKLRRSYFMLNKPRGYVTTMSDEQNRKCVKDLLGGINALVNYVGRLDRDSEGLLILTDDGELVAHLTHPSAHFPKVYRVTVKGHVPLDSLKKLREGVELDDGYITMPARVVLKEEKEDRTTLIITIYEGKNRQIRRMCDTLKFEVMQLKRIAFGNIKLGGLKLGGYRMLTDEEVEYLKGI